MSVAFTPEDVAVIGKRIAAGETSEAIAATYSCDRKVILRLARKHDLGPWASRTNVPQQKRRPAPVYFAQMNAIMSDNEMSRHYKCGGSAPARWRRELGILPTNTRIGGSNKLPMPEDFKTWAPGKTIAEISQRYGFGVDTARRFRNEAGIYGMPTGRPARYGTAAKPAHLVRNAYMSTPIDRTTRDYSRAGMAAEFLRRDAPVYRCRPLGAADAQGSHWRYGRIVLTDVELVERAERKGWAADAWARVA